MQMDSWLVVIYVLVLGLVTPYVMELPTRLALGRVNRQGVFGRPVTRGMGLGLVLLLQVLGFGLWFALCLVPIKFSRDMNALYSPGVWFGVPFFFGLVVVTLIRRGMKRKR